MKLLINLLLFLLLFNQYATADENALKVDEETGFIIDTHWELAKTHCIACHSARHVTLQRGTRQMWLDMIRWMQDTQGLWKLDKETEENLLDYLAKNYAPEGEYRRAPIPPELMPEKPKS
jgi:hypothetical protein